ncbi:MAG: hypothetical protein ACD_7C00045G0003 [uncultured bacterium]|nr:MAG: hypothetical protein ACD_7C00045G0003 [uncultured bacterium]KKP69212.1 MAG: hypothetical protein UR66_C0001G0094 [Candidatus Moranbacteria bacterium GW2011_GWE1_35_17]KKP81157.1 MAG: hypothetical protein UR82_C0071G0017 [Candidatus Moranbacteria bacterium GW2011_GWF1_35_5]KKP85186.1 MAG: hypothetical protein UR83_C0003G0021 [Candidatus Moranbacteria bacterium GW2011_GWF2_35_54]HBR79506.1 hypothetical protein [Candidatus Moranbacteria bacterium]
MKNNRKKECLNLFISREVVTASGQIIQFAAHPDDIDRIAEAIEEVNFLSLPITGVVKNDIFQKHTRYDIVQHEYAGGSNSYIEVLEIKNPPDGRCGTVVYQYVPHDKTCFFEFDTIENAKKAWRHYVSSYDHEHILKQKGFLRKVECGILTPWFYAKGNQLLQGDYVFLDLIQDDPEFRFGAKYIVWDFLEKIPTVKRCMGVRTFLEKSCCSGGRKEERKIVYWHDGTYWEKGGGYKPRLLQEEDLWIQEAIDKFRELLAGKTTEFAVDFLDGSKFIGTWKPKDKKSKHAEGVYNAKVILKGGSVREVEFSFTPTIEAPTVEKFLHSNARESGVEIEKIETLVKITKKSHGQRKWSGVYLPLPC